MCLSIRLIAVWFAVWLPTVAQAQEELPPGQTEEINAQPVAEEQALPKEATAPPASAEVQAGPRPLFQDQADGRSPTDAVVGRWGLGYFTGSAPLGVRHWLDRISAFDVGVDLALKTGGTHGHRYGLEGGYLLALAHYHYAVVFARGGLGFVFKDTTGRNAGPASYDVNANLFAGAEMFLGALGFPNVSMQGGYGLTATYTYSRGSRLVVGVSEPGLSLVTTGTLGFHIYL